MGGVVPGGAKMELENTGVALNPRGFIEVDGNLRTKVPGIFAFGDVIGNYLFRHCANYEGEYLLENVIYPLAHSKGLLPAEKVAWLPSSVAQAVAGQGCSPEQFIS